MVGEAEELELAIVTGGGGTFGGLLESSGAAERLREIPVETGTTVFLPAPVKELAGRLSQLGFESAGVQARLEWDIKVE